MITIKLQMYNHVSVIFFDNQKPIQELNIQ